MSQVCYCTSRVAPSRSGELREPSIPMLAWQACFDDVIRVLYIAIELSMQEAFDHNGYLAESAKLRRKGTEVSLVHS